VKAYATLPEPTKDIPIQYPVIFHVTLEKSLYSTSQLSIPMGTVLQAPGNASSLVIGEENCFVILTQLYQEVQQTCAAYSLEYDKTQPKKMPAGTQYIIGMELTTPLALAMFEVNRTLQEPYGDYVTQVALWKLVSNVNIAEIKKGSGWMISDENAAKAEELAGKAGDQLAAGKVGNVSPILIIVGAVLGLAVILAGLITIIDLAKKKNKNAAEAAASATGLSNVNWNSTKQQAPPAHLQNTGIAAPPPSPAVRQNLLTAVSGPLAGHKYPLNPPCVISRGKVEWLLFPEENLASPEVMFDLAETPFRYKVLSVKGKVLWKSCRELKYL